MTKKMMSLLLAGVFLTACESSKVCNDKSGFGQTYVPGSTEDFRMNVGDTIFFGFDRYDLSPEGSKILECQAKWLKTYETIQIVVQGHTDARGTRDYNLALGARRAEAVKKALVSLGISEDRLKIISYGKEKAAEATDEAGHAKNRKAVLEIS